MYRINHKSYSYKNGKGEGASKDLFLRKV